jgi:endonuclease G, mitochondrial
VLLRRLLPALLALALLLAVVALPTRAQDPSPHLALGNPSGATTDPNQPANYLLVREQYALGYIRDDGIPRWVSWRLVAADLGTTPRYSGSFFRDESLPAGWRRIAHGEYTNSGYDRGHMVPSEDRTATVETNESTFFLTNVLPQAPRNNRGPWLRLEETGRDLAEQGDEVFVVAGPEGELVRLAAGALRVPAATWKVLLAVPPGPGEPISRVTTATRLIAIRVPNDKDDATVQQSDPWQEYRTTADAIEAANGLDLFSALPATVQRVLEARADVGALAYSLTISGTDTLSTTVGTAFPTPLAVRVTGPGGEAVAGVPVTFAALGEEANALVGGDVVAVVLTDANGVAVLAPVASTSAGVYRLEASIAGVFEPAVFVLENVPAPTTSGTTLYLPLLRR